jgi:hypothetical protein
MHSEQSLVGFVNSESKRFKQIDSRKALIGFVRAALKDSEPYEGYRVASGHFEKGEPGVLGSPLAWDFAAEERLLTQNEMVFELWMQPSEHVPIVRLTRKLARNKGMKIKWLGPSDSRLDSPIPDVYFAGSQIKNDRQVWLQTALGWDRFKSNLRDFPKTTAALETIRTMSSATMPVEIESLQNFERSAYQELSVFPAARYRSSQFSRKNSAFELVPDERDELKIRRRLQK